MVPGKGKCLPRCREQVLYPSGWPNPSTALRAELVSHPRLHARLYRKLILISASAGFGMTMLLRECVARYSLHSGATDLTSFAV